MKNGMQLVFSQVIPALYPFILLTTFLKNRSEKNKTSSKLMIPLAFLSGYPLGAKVIAQNTEYPQSSKQSLLLLCNNPSPAYMMSFVGFQCFKDLKMGLLIYLSVLIANMLCAFLRQMFTNLIEPKQTSDISLHSCDTCSISLDDIIQQTFFTIINISSYILFFCLISAFIKELSFFSTASQSILTGLLEMTTGIEMITHLECSQTLKSVLVTGISSFGGLSVIAQTNSMIKGSSLSIKKYMADKAITAATAMSVMYIFTRFIG